MTISDLSSSCLDLSKVIRRHWPWPIPYLPIVAKLVVSWGFLRLWGRVCGSFFLIDLFLIPLYRLRCQSGHFTQFALGRFSRWRRRSLPGCYASSILDRHRNNASYAQNWMKNTLVKVSFRYSKYFWRYDLAKLKNCRFPESLTLDLSYLGQVLS